MTADGWGRDEGTTSKTFGRVGSAFSAVAYLTLPGMSAKASRLASSAP
jgi:hypothetical protein